MGHTFLIAFSGLDGSGKTANANILAQRLRSQGIRCKYLWTGWKPSISYPFLALMRLLGLTERVKINGKVFVVRNYHLRPLRIIWPTLFFLDYVIHSAIRVRLTKWLGENVVCDRYVYDMLAWLLADDMCPSIIRRLAPKFFAWPSISLLLDVKESTSWDRTLQGERTLEQPLYDITVRRRTYHKLAQLYGMTVIDGERPFEQVNDEVTRSVFAKLLRIRSASGFKS